jgi:hypothetical protein
MNRSNWTMVAVLAVFVGSRGSVIFGSQEGVAEGGYGGEFRSDAGATRQGPGGLHHPSGSSDPWSAVDAELFTCADR